MKSKPIFDLMNLLMLVCGSVAIRDGGHNGAMKMIPTQPISEALRAVFKRLHYPIDVMLTCVRWYVAYPVLSKYSNEPGAG